MTATGASIVARAVTKTYLGPDGQPFQALRNISLSIHPGELTALVGPDGAGKSTFMRMACGLLKVDGGSLTVLGHDASREPQAIQDRISYMPQRFGLYEDLSVQENLDLYADLHGVAMAERRQRFARLLAMTDLAKFTARPAGKLSGGMKQKLGLACTLVRSPDLLLLDEPSVGVDPLSRRDLWQILEQLIDEEQLSVVVSTAYMDEAERCAQVYVLNQGELLAEGSPASLRTRAAGLTYRVTPPTGVPARNWQARLIDNRELIVDAVPKGGAVRLIREPHCREAEISQLLDGAELQARPAELEDAFMLLLRRHQSDDQPGPQAQPVASQTAVTAPAEGEAVIRVRNLVRKFGDFTAVASTSFEVARGEIFGLLGPNGAGKTTTFRMLCGLLPASGGQLEVAGLNLRHARAQARGRIGYVAQKFSLYGLLSVRENLDFFGGAYGLRGRHLRSRIASVLAQFDLDPAATSGDLPGGFKQRLAMAAGLLHEPEILFLDEPTSGIDPIARRLFWRTITSLAESGVTVVITTHFMEEAEYCDRIAIQDAGQLLALGTPQQVREQAGGDQHSDMNSAFIGVVEQSRVSLQRAGSG
ncbi:ATP-binding cassette domain-containing protein [Halioxenophilus sp. WMMB6]|uniref:ATP-binding cassette domain-containing protein n=1 Tax=Halioxenophilus sp. WMMB6 TaxID=3073815 RepID=UPI00295EBB00|nr:ATP-binding cassette domain-containing protein [Halioxenophilus sp. WMMB6]